MGQQMSRRHSDDTLNLFPPFYDSSTSLANDSPVDNTIIRDNYTEKKKFKRCRKISKLKKSLSECFRSNFTRLHEIENDNAIEEIMNSPRQNSGHSDLLVTENRTRRLNNSNNSFIDRELPLDIHEIHEQLSSLMDLLNTTGDDGSWSNCRDVSCQTTEKDDFELLLQQKDSLIFSQQDTLNSLQLQLDNNKRIIDKCTREIAILKAQHTRYRFDINNTNNMISFLKDIRERRMFVSGDLERMDEVIEHMSSLSQSNKYQTEKTNVAVINPCSNLKSESSLFSSTTTSLPLQSDSATLNLPINPFNNHVGEVKDYKETKLICFLEHSKTPYVSTIPISSSRITLSHVKYYTKAVLPKNANCRYIFRSIASSSGQTQEEISRDTDLVPVQDNKIVVRIRM